MIPSNDPLWRPIDPHEVEMTLLAYCFRSTLITYRLLFLRYNYEGVFEDERAAMLSESIRCLSIFEKSFKHPAIISELCHQMRLRCDNSWEVNVLVRDLVERRESFDRMPPERIKKLVTRGMIHLSLRADKIEMENAKQEEL